MHIVNDFNTGNKDISEGQPVCDLVLSSTGRGFEIPHGHNTITHAFYGKTYEHRYAFYYSDNWGMKLVVFSTRPPPPRVGPNEIGAEVANTHNTIL